MTDDFLLVEIVIIGLKVGGRDTIVVLENADVIIRKRNYGVQAQVADVVPNLTPQVNAIFDRSERENQCSALKIVQ